jgi:hypothetical protein
MVAVSPSYFPVASSLPRSGMIGISYLSIRFAYLQGIYRNMSAMSTEQPIALHIFTIAISATQRNLCSVYDTQILAL